MEVTKQDKLFEHIEKSIAQVDNQKQLAVQYQVTHESIVLHDRVINHFKKIKSLLERNKLSINYVNQFQNEINQTLELFPYRNHKSNEIKPPQIESVRQGIETYKDRISVVFS